MYYWLKQGEKKMYILIFEDGSIAKAKTISDDEIDACDDGTLDIIKVIAVDGEPKCTQYHDGDWVELDDLTQ
jgi:hypothetical protein